MNTARGFSGNRAVGGFCAAAYGVYLVLLHPDVDWGDSGELISAAHLLAPAHFLGYPLYVIPAKFFALMPLGSAALRVSWFSALLGTATLGVLMMALMRSIGNRESGLAGRMKPMVLWAVVGLLAAVGLSHAFMGQSIQAENTLPALLLLALGLWCLHGSAGAHRVGYAVFSFLAAYHPALLPISLLGGGVLASGFPNGRRLREFGLYMAVQAAAMSVNLFLLVRSQASVPLSYAFARTPADWLSTLQTGFRKYYGSDLVPVLAVDRASDSIQVFLPQFAAVVTPLALYGLYRLIRRYFRLSALMIPMLILFSALALLNPSQEREGYSLLIVVALLWLTGAGLVGIASLRWRRPALAAVLLIGAGGWLAAAFNVYDLARKGVSQSEIARRLGEEILAELEGRALYVAANERLALVTEYIQFVELRRPDVVLAYLPMFFTEGGARRVEERHPDLLPPLVRLPAGQFSCALPLWDVYVSQLVARNIARFPIYTETHAAWSFPSQVDARTMSAFVRTGVRDFREYIYLAADGLTEQNLPYRFLPSNPVGGKEFSRRGFLYAFGGPVAPITKRKLLRIWETDRTTPIDEEVLTQTLYQWAAYDFAKGRLREAVDGYRLAGSSYRRTT
ncbi:MAG: DUF2723 domain-containing protein [Nitrospirae bacterium]|nr:DUF2723 domain-containing protein [Nitrospirota bacterium]